MRGLCDGPGRPLSDFRNRGRLLRDRLEQRWHHALPVADKERHRDRTNSSAPDARAKPGAPTPEVANAVAAVRRYFEGKETDFSTFKLDLGEQDPFFERVYGAARQVGWGRTTTYGALAKELGAGPEPRAMSARPWRRIRWH